jgi:hypothetical protein
MYVKPALGTKITVARASLTNDTKGSWRASTATSSYVHFFNATQCLPPPVAADKPTPVAAAVACAARCEIAKAQAVCLAGKMTSDTCAADLRTCLCSPKPKKSCLLGAFTCNAIVSAAQATAGSCKDICTPWPPAPAPAPG